MEKSNLILAAVRADTEGNRAEPAKDLRAVADKILVNGGVVIKPELEEDAD